MLFFDWVSCSLDEGILIYHNFCTENDRRWPNFSLCWNNLKCLLRGEVMYMCNTLSPTSEWSLYSPNPCNLTLTGSWNISAQSSKISPADESQMSMANSLVHSIPVAMYWLIFFKVPMAWSTTCRGTAILYCYSARGKEMNFTAGWRLILELSAWFIMNVQCIDFHALDTWTPKSSRLNCFQEQGCVNTPSWLSSLMKFIKWLWSHWPWKLERLTHPKLQI